MILFLLILLVDINSTFLNIMTFELVLPYQKHYKFVYIGAEL